MHSVMPFMLKNSHSNKHIRLVRLLLTQNHPLEQILFPTQPPLRPTFGRKNGQKDPILTNHDGI